MSGGQIAAFICALLLLLPGGCFLFLGIGMTISSADRIERELGPEALAVGIGLALLIAFLFWVAFRRRNPPAPPAPPSMAA